MENSGLKIESTVMREDGSIAQHIGFTQNGLTYTRLLEMQAKVVMPAVQAILATLAGWDDVANAKAAQEDGV